MAKLFKSAFDADTSIVAPENFYGCISVEEAKRIASLPSSLSDADLIEERSVIEAKAQANDIYHYSSQWDDTVIKHLKEYASIFNCGVKAINPEDEGIQQLANASEEQESLNKEASSTNSAVAQPTIELDDPFERNVDMSHLNKIDWERVVPESKLSSPKSTASSARVISISGNERVDVHPHLTTARGRNSITNPYALDDLAKDESQDVGQRLRQASELKEKARQAEVRASDKLMAQQAQAKGYGAFANQHTVIITDSADGQSNIRPKSALDFTSMPDKTAGEMLAEESAKRKSSIQRNNNEDKDSWNKPSRASRYSISDVFAESLEKQLNKNK